VTAIGAHAGGAGRRDPVPLVVAAGLIAIYLLLPLDRGFPTPYILGQPFNAAILAVGAACLVLLFHSRGRVLALLADPYVRWQLLFVAVHLAGSLRAVRPFSALHGSLVYLSTFVLLYGLFRYVVQQGWGRQLSQGVVIVGFSAATLSLLQALGGVNLPRYEGWYLSYFGQEAVPDAVGVRQTGTLGNPIVFGTAMALVLPHLPSVGRWWIVAAPVVVGAGLMTASRTWLLLALVIAFGTAMVYRSRAVRAIIPIVAAVAVAVSLGAFRPLASDPRFLFIAGRLGLIEVGPDLMNTALNVEIRKEALLRGLSEMAFEWGPGEWLAGRGVLSAQEVGRGLSAAYDTVDNAFFGVLYETGILGLIPFVAAFLVLLHRARREARTSLLWYGPVALLAAGVSFSFELYSTCNVAAIAALALIAREADVPTGAALVQGQT
jgi:hypothetical protein